MDQKPPPKSSPFPWGMWTPSNTPMPGLTPLSTPNGNLFMLFCTTMPQSPHWLQWDAPHPPPSKLHLAWGNHQSQLPASSSDPADTPPQTASRSNQLFCHNAPDRLTDGPGDKSCINTRFSSVKFYYTATWLIILKCIGDSPINRLQ